MSNPDYSDDKMRDLPTSRSTLCYPVQLSPSQESALLAIARAEGVVFGSWAQRVLQLRTKAEIIRVEEDADSRVLVHVRIPRRFTRAQTDAVHATPWKELLLAAWARAQIAGMGANDNDVR